MNPEVRARLFGAEHAFDHPVTVAVTIAVLGLLVIAPIIIWLLVQLGRVNAKLRGELFLRYRSWLVITPLILMPILLGAAWTILGVGVLSLLCYREYARATGLFREKAVSLVVVLCMLVVTFTVLDHWYYFFVATLPFAMGFIAIVAILRDQPHGYIQRVALGVLGFALFGTCLGHLGYFANDLNYRPIFLLILLSVELNDIFAFICGKTFGKRKFAPNTSPNKTVAGAIGAFILTTILVIVIGSYVFEGTILQGWKYLAVLGGLISVLGQFGDLMLSSIKRDLGIKDMGNSIPGHGGLLDRFDSIILVAPVAFHYIGYFIGIGNDQKIHVITGG